METIEKIITTAKALVDAVAFDDCGAIVGGHLVGGNGGLVSRETIRKADALRLALDAHKKAVEQAVDIVAAGSVEGVGGANG